MWWRANFIQWSILTVGIATASTMLLMSLMLLPAITNGPDNVTFLERGICVVENVTYFSNLCLRDTDTDFGNLEYNPHWEECKLARFNISNNLGLECTWVFPEFFETEREAFIAITQRFKIGEEYKCVINTIDMVCYEDQHEVLIYGLTIGVLGFISFCSLCIYCFLRVKWKRRLRR
jgi:hypothetical protein